MKTLLLKSYYLLFFLFPLIVLAQDEEDPDGPPLPPDVPINKSIYLLAIAGITAAYILLKKTNKQLKP